MENLGVRQSLKSKVVQGENIGMAYQYVSSGNVALGFVALSQVMSEGKIQDGSAWIIPTWLHSPIHQDAVALGSSNDNPAARALLTYLKGEKAKAMIRLFGYELP